MQLYSHKLDFRIWHPTLDPDLVSRTLGLEVQRSWRAGDPRSTLVVADAKLTHVPEFC